MRLSVSLNITPILHLTSSAIQAEAEVEVEAEAEIEVDEEAEVVAMIRAGKRSDIALLLHLIHHVTTNL